MLEKRYHVVTVFLDGMTDATDVIVGVVTHLMPLRLDALIQFRILPDIVAYHKERSLRPVFFENVEDEGRCLWDGAVVEGQIDGLLVTVHSPIGFRI